MSLYCLVQLILKGKFVNRSLLNLEDETKTVSWRPMTLRVITANRTCLLASWWVRHKYLHCSALYILFQETGNVGSNLKIIVFYGMNLNETAFFSILDRTFCYKKMRQLSEFFCSFYSKIKTKMGTSGLTWKKV